VFNFADRVRILSTHLWYYNKCLINYILAMFCRMINLGPFQNRKN
jgi:hypothetical protein